MSNVKDMTPAQIVRFWSKGTARGECLIWSGYCTDKGYGKVNIRQTIMRAHRVAYELTYGEIGPEGQVDHKCHARACINPVHLREVTQKQNQENRRGASFGNVSGVRGVHWHETAKGWVAAVGHNGASIYLGVFSTVAAAEAVVVAKRLELFTHNDVDREAAA